MSKEELVWVSEKLELISEDLMELEEGVCRLMTYIGDDDKIRKHIYEAVRDLRGEAFNLFDQVATLKEKGGEDDNKRIQNS